MSRNRFIASVAVRQQFVSPIGATSNPMGKHFKSVSKCLPIQFFFCFVFEWRDNSSSKLSQIKPIVRKKPVNSLFNTRSCASLNCCAQFYWCWPVRVYVASTHSISGSFTLLEQQNQRRCLCQTIACIVTLGIGVAVYIYALGPTIFRANVLIR